MVSRHLLYTSATLKEHRCKTLADAKPEGALGLDHAVIEDHICQQDKDGYTTYLDVVLGSRSCGLSLPFPPQLLINDSICSTNETHADIKSSLTTSSRSSCLPIITANHHSMLSKPCAFSVLSTKSRTGSSPSGWTKPLNAYGLRFPASMMRRVPY